MATQLRGKAKQRQRQQTAPLRARLKAKAQAVQAQRRASVSLEESRPPQCSECGLRPAEWPETMCWPCVQHWAKAEAERLRAQRDPNGGQ
jgi:hypothetical protein